LFAAVQGRGFETDSALQNRRIGTKIVSLGIVGYLFGYFNLQVCHFEFYFDFSRCGTNFHFFRRIVLTKFG